MVPNAPSGPRKGTAAIERIARVRHTSGSTRLSLSVSLQRCTLGKRKHSPAIPESTSSKAPNSGPTSPLRARHTTSPLVRSAIAVPFAPVRIRAGRSPENGLRLPKHCPRLSAESRWSARFVQDGRKSATPTPDAMAVRFGGKWRRQLANLTRS
jgi:hypothetical protein